MTVRILVGDVFDRLAELPDESVHCVATSPPYFGLRDYGVKGAIGLEPTFEAHLDVLVRVFREVRRVLRKDGTCWLNYGDAYAGSWGAQSRGNPCVETSTLWGGQVYAAPKGTHTGSTKRTPGLKPKDLMMMPARVALALQADGWWLRSEIIYAKANPMPESVTDRPTSAHEKVFLLTRSARYFYDADAVRIPVTGGAHARRKDGERKPAKGSDPNDRRAGTWKERPTKMPDGWDTGPGTHGRFHRKGREKGKRAQPPRHEAHGQMHNGLAALDEMPKAEQQANGANLRNVWTIATHSFPGAHFATFPPALVEPCIKAGTSEKGCCAECGSPWGRDVEKSTRFESGSGRAGNPPNGKHEGSDQATSGIYDIRMGPCIETRTIGWNPTCDHDAGPIPCTVLDPFGGSGTVGLVAARRRRDAILIELNPAYAEMARRRIRDDAPLLTEVA